MFIVIGRFILTTKIILKHSDTCTSTTCRVACSSSYPGPASWFHRKWCLDEWHCWSLSSLSWLVNDWNHGLVGILDLLSATDSTFEEFDILLLTIRIY